MRTPSKSIGIPFNLPIDTTLCWFDKFNWIGENPNVGSPIDSHVFLGKTFTSDPKSSIISPILKSPMFAFNLNSLLVLLFLRTWLTIFYSNFISSLEFHFSNRLYNTCKEFIEDPKTFHRWLNCSNGWSLLVWSNRWGMSYTGTSTHGFVPKVDTILFFKISCLSSLNISFSLHTSKLFWSVVFFMTQWCWS